ncbi:MAG TPA: DUF3037 domain-containing protein [Solirubrobacterales bacterium]|nr:DUF3037 domain-containing protein [Solirubrobacterales bacterium]
MGYQYSIIYFVPDSMSIERVSVGIIATDSNRRWDVRLTPSFRRVRALDTWATWDTASSILDEIRHQTQSQLDVEGSNRQVTSTWLEELSSALNGPIQITDPVPIRATSLREAIELAFNRFVPQQHRRLTERRRQKTLAKNVTQEIFDNFGVGTAVKKSAQFSSGVYEYEFDFFLHNGRGLQLTQCWSFDLSDQRRLARNVRSWGWIVNELRRSGGLVKTTDNQTFEIDKELEVASVYVEPTTGRSEALLQAESIFEELEVNAVPISDAERVGERAQELLGV